MTAVESAARHGRGFSVHWHDDLPSTQDEALRRLALGESGFVVAARAQSAGRGRRGSTWHAPAGAALLASFGLDIPAGRAASDLTLVLALSLWESLAPLLPADARNRLKVKWPNDLWFAGEKLAGILGEARTLGETTRVALGAGVNLLQRREDFPAAMEPAPVSLALAGGTAVPGPEAFLVRLMPHFASRLEQWRAAGLSVILEALADHWLFATGDRLSIEWGERPCSARYHGISGSGALQVTLEREPGRIVELPSGEVRRLRGADAPAPR
jgi:BirA family biotin operon repressor/biotin-[acetyl-CoA-carboxylase] ligase